MALINSFDKTKLRSLKYGGDRPGGGNSNQPYIESKIPKPDQYPAPKVKLVEAVERSFEDIKRLGKWFSQPLLNGILFTAKQNLLSRTAVPAQGGTSQAPKLLNEGVYTPLSTSPFVYVSRKLDATIFTFNDGIGSKLPVVTVCVSHTISSVG